MGEAVFFRNLTTKGLTAVNSGERYFEGFLTVQVKDKQGEVTIVDELMKVLPVWIDRGAPISDTHSNRIIGKGINYAKTIYKDAQGDEYPAIKVTGKIHKNYELDNDIWSKIKSGEYKGLSFGGATKSDREPMRMKDGSIAYSLKDLEHYEVAVCRDPAVPLALITEINTLAKAAVDGEDIGGGRMMIKCTRYGCYVEKDNKEAGLKVPEASREAQVYEDTSKDQPIELENKAGCPWCDEGGHGAAHPKESEHDYKKLREMHDDDPDTFHKDFPFEKKKADDDIPSAEDIEEYEKRKKEEEAKKKKRIPPKPKESTPTWGDKVSIAAQRTENVGQTKRNKPTSNAGIEAYRGTEQGADETLRELDEAFGDKKKDPKKKKKKDKEKAVITNILSRLKSLRLLTQGYSDEFKEDGDSWEQHTFKKRKRKKKAELNKTEDCPSCGISDKEVANREMVSMDNKCPNCGKEKHKGEDWSNADGDRTSYYTQDVDEGGTGKHKQKKDGYGGEQNNAGEVGWSGSGSPYPKVSKNIKKDSLIKIEDNDDNNTQVTVLDEWKNETHPDKNGKTEGIRTTKAEIIFNGKKYNSIHDVPFKMPHIKREKKPTKAERERDEKEWKRDEKLSRQMDEDAAKELKDRDDVSREHSSHNTPTQPFDRLGTKDPRRKKATITNILSRLKSMDLLIKRGEFTYSERTTFKKKDLNLGETEWTEPRDTANDRRDSKLADTEKTNWKDPKKPKRYEDGDSKDDKTRPKDNYHPRSTEGKNPRHRYQRNERPPVTSPNLRNNKPFATSEEEQREKDEVAITSEGMGKNRIPHSRVERKPTQGNRNTSSPFGQKYQADVLNRKITEPDKDIGSGGGIQSLQDHADKRTISRENAQKWKSIEALLLTVKGNKKGTRKKQPVKYGKRPDGSIPWNSPLRNPDGSLKDREEKVEIPKQSEFDKQRRYHNPKDLQTGKRGEKTRRATSSKAPQTGDSTNFGVVVDHTGAGKGATEEAEAKRVSSMLESKDEARRKREEETGKKCNCESCRARRAEGNDDT